MREDLLVGIFNRQNTLQRVLGIDFDDLTTAERVELVKQYILAAEDELHEVLNETSWKPWATGVKFNEENIKRELVDVLCFLVNLCLLAGMSPLDLAGRHAAKTKVNIARQETGYTDQAKCPVCEMEEHQGPCAQEPLPL